MTTSEMGAIGTVLFLLIWMAAGYLSLWDACRDQRRKVTKPSGAGAELWQ